MQPAISIYPLWQMASNSRAQLPVSGVPAPASGPDISSGVYPTGTLAFRALYFRMSSDRAIVDAIKVARTLLSQNLPPAYNLPDAATVTRVRELVHSPSIRSALERSSDTLLAFALRAVELVVADQSLTNRQIITRLWDVLDDPHLNQALGLPQNSRIAFGQYPKRR